MQNQEIYNQEESSLDNFAIVDMLMIGLRNWYWFAISIVVCLSLTYLYTKTVSQIYEAEAIILIKSDQKNKGGVLSESAIFSDMGLGNNSNSVENEIYVLRSFPLIESVVNRLSLDVTYSLKPLLRNVDIYDKTPLKVHFIDKEIMGELALDVLPISESRYKYKSIDGDNERTGEANFGDTVAIDNGRFVITPTPLFTSKSLDQTVYIQLNPKTEVIKGIIKKLSVNRPDKVTNVLKLRIENDNFDRAKEILNTLIAAYNEDVINDKNRVATNTEKFIVERISTISTDLGGIDGQIEQLKKENKITDFTSTSGLLLQTGSKYKEESVAIATEISLVELIRDYLSDPAKKNELIPTNIGISDSGIEQQIVAYNQEHVKLDKMLINSGAKNPVVIELINTLNITKSNMLQSIDNLLESLKIKFDRAKTQENIATRRIESVPTQEKEVNDVVRQQKIKEELYLYLLNKREENALNLAITESNAKIIEGARGENIPIAPRTLTFLMVAFIIGFAIPAGVIFAITCFDNTVHDKKDIERRTTVPILGQLPSKTKERKSEDIIISETGRDRISEAFRIARSNMDFMAESKEGRAKIIQMTSTMAGEGKTFVTVNLALSYAHTGKKVLVMDMDLRKGRMTNVLTGNRKIGSSTYLSGKTDKIEDIINKGVQHKNLDFITTGIIPPNPITLLMSDRFSQMMDQLSPLYDYIIMDTVPYSVIADAAIINKVADITIYVMRSGKVDKRYLSEIDKIYKEEKLKNLVILLTDVNIDKYHYGYGYGYGYGKGYLEGEEA